MTWLVEDHIKTCRQILEKLGLELVVHRSEDTMPGAVRAFSDVHHENGVVHIVCDPMNPKYSSEIYDFSAALWHETGHAMASSTWVRQNGINWQQPDTYRPFWTDKEQENQVCELTCAALDLLDVPYDDKVVIMDFVRFNESSIGFYRGYRSLSGWRSLAMSLLSLDDQESVPTI